MGQPKKLSGQVPERGLDGNARLRHEAGTAAFDSKKLKRHASDATGERWQRSVSAARSPNGAPLASALFRSSRSNSAW